MRVFIKKILGAGMTLKVSNKEMKDIKKVKSFEDSDLLIKSVTQAIENETKGQRGDFLVCC